MRALVLAYHSGNIFGSEYRDNDHVALAKDLPALTLAGARLVGLDDVVKAHSDGVLDGSADQRPLVALTFDDGPVFDVQDFVHPRHGHQRSFLNTMRDFAFDLGHRHPELAATSFVIASPHARAAMEQDPECGFPDQGHWLTEAWWPGASGRNLLRLGNHSWDHVHPTVPNLAVLAQPPGDFSVVDDHAAATSEIRHARRFIEAVAGERCRYFAYPYGHTNRYLTQTYFPGYQDEHGMAAAFTTEGRRVESHDSIWALPRAVCGEHWHSEGELIGLLFG